MKSTPFVDDLLATLSPFGAMAKFMMGGYCLYCEGVLVGLVCADVLYLKQFDENKNYLARCSMQPPYEHARPHFVVSTDDEEFLFGAIALTV